MSEDERKRDEAPGALEGHLEALRKFVRVRLGAALRVKETSQDLVQSVCREALAELDQSRTERKLGLRDWLFVRAERKIKDRARHWRRDKRASERERELAAADRESDPLTPSRIAAAREELARLERAFQQLTEDQRRVIYLVRLLGRSHAEAAVELEKSEVATRSLLSRALARLATTLEE